MNLSDWGLLQTKPALKADAIRIVWVLPAKGGDPEVSIRQTSYQGVNWIVSTVGRHLEIVRDDLLRLIKV